MRTLHGGKEVQRLDEVGELTSKKSFLRGKFTVVS